MRIYVIFTLLLIIMSPLSLMGQSVTVHSAGPPSGDYATLNAAIAAVKADAAEPDIITILDAGPFLESAQVLIDGAPASGLTITSSPGVRPRIAINGSVTTARGSMFIQTNNTVTVENLIIMPQEGTTPARAGIEVDDVAAGQAGFVITLRNILICPSLAGNVPAAALDGNSVTGGGLSFTGEGIWGQSTVQTQTHKLYMYDVIVCGLDGTGNNYGVRSFMDGAPASGSELILGEGCVISYCNGSGAQLLGAFQPGGNENCDVKILGTQTKPVKIFNNSGTAGNGIHITGTGTADKGLKEITWCLVAGNSGAGFFNTDSDQNVTFSNCTFAGNSLKCIEATATFSGTYTATGNCIFAGNGTANLNTNVIDVSTSGIGTMTITDSAVVLAGPFQLDTTNFDLDGLDDNTPTSNVTKANVISADPEFMSIDPTNSDFFKVGNSLYAVAGPGGGPLGGAMGYGGLPPTKVSYSHWNLFE